jgi:hypothetical protein
MGSGSLGLRRMEIILIPRNLIPHGAYCGS